MGLMQQLSVVRRKWAIDNRCSTITATHTCLTLLNVDMGAGSFSLSVSPFFCLLLLNSISYYSVYFNFLHVAASSIVMLSMFFLDLFNIWNPRNIAQFPWIFHQHEYHQGSGCTIPWCCHYLHQLPPSTAYLSLCIMLTRYSGFSGVP